MVNLPPKRQMANSPSKSATSCPLGKIMTDQPTDGHPGLQGSYTSNYDCCGRWNERGEMDPVEKD